MLPGALTQAEFEARMDEFRCVRVQCFVCLTRRHGAIAAIFLASRFLLSIHTHQGQASPAPAAPHRALLHHGAAQWPVRAAARQGMRLRQGAGECMLWGGGVVAAAVAVWVVDWPSRTGQNSPLAPPSVLSESTPISSNQSHRSPPTPHRPGPEWGGYRALDPRRRAAGGAPAKAAGAEARWAAAAGV